MGNKVFFSRLTKTVMMVSRGKKKIFFKGEKIPSADQRDSDILGKDFEQEGPKKRETTAHSHDKQRLEFIVYISHSLPLITLYFNNNIGGPHYPKISPRILQFVGNGVASSLVSCLVFPGSMTKYLLHDALDWLNIFTIC